MVRATSPEALPNLTVDQLQYALTKYWTICLNKDDPPLIKDLPSDEKWVADEWSSIQRGLPRAQQVGSAPASAPPVKLPPKPIPIAKPAPATTGATAWGSPQPLCTKNGMKTIYLPKTWRCQKPS
jgi:hypothetical protein